MLPCLKLPTIFGLKSLKGFVEALSVVVSTSLEVCSTTCTACSRDPWTEVRAMFICKCSPAGPFCRHPGLTMRTKNDKKMPGIGVHLLEAYSQKTTSKYMKSGKKSKPKSGKKVFKQSEINLSRLQTCCFFDPRRGHACGLL